MKRKVEKRDTMKILSPNHSDFKSSGAKRHDYKLSASPSGFFFPLFPAPAAMAFEIEIRPSPLSLPSLSNFGFPKKSCNYQTLEEELVQAWDYFNGCTYLTLDHMFLGRTGLAVCLDIHPHICLSGVGDHYKPWWQRSGQRCTTLTVSRLWSFSLCVPGLLLLLTPILSLLLSSLPLWHRCVVRIDFLIPIFLLWWIPVTVVWTPSSYKLFAILRT